MSERKVGWYGSGVQEERIHESHEPGVVANVRISSDPIVAFEKVTIDLPQLSPMKRGLPCLPRQAILTLSFVFDSQSSAVIWNSHLR
jgi:hypothetical protein